MVQRCSCILLLEYEKHAGAVNELLSTIVPYLTKMLTTSEEPISETIGKLEQTVKQMTAIGSRFKNLEQSLQAGATLCLGTSLPESS